MLRSLVWGVFAAFPCLAVGEGPTAGQRIDSAVAVTRELASKAEEAPPELFRSVQPMPVWPGDRESAESFRFPRREHVFRYAEVRPWSRHYSRRPTERGLAAGIRDWPTDRDGPRLAELLEVKDPGVRALAAEALATLHRPADVLRIAQLLHDPAEAPPELSWNMQMTATMLAPSTTAETEEKWRKALVLLRSWQPRRVRTYALRALTLMTGEDFSKKDFATWWESNQVPRHRVWYWQRRLVQELAEASSWPPHTWPPDLTRRQSFADYERRRDERSKVVLDAIGDELRQLPAEVEAKVRLLAKNDWSTVLGIGLDAPFWPSFDCPRVTPERCLELLERKNLWPDVDWGGAAGSGTYSRMVAVLASSSKPVFGPEHAPRLQAVLAREKRRLRSSSRADLTLAISRLLPAAEAGHLDDPNTREGVLRATIRTDRDNAVSARAATELIAVGLTQNWDFFKAQFFLETDPTSFPDLRQAIICALGTPPLGPEKRVALRELLLDERFVELWKLSNRQGAGRDLYRVFAIRAVNAHAGKKALHDGYNTALNDPDRAGKVLPEVLRIVAAALDEETELPEN